MKLPCDHLTSDLFPSSFSVCLSVFQVVLVGSSINERDQMLFISKDEGSSFQRQSISFTPDTLIFHPKEEDKLLAYCKEGMVGITALQKHENKTAASVAERMNKKRAVIIQQRDVSAVSVAMHSSSIFTRTSSTRTSKKN